jgi:hypothetical protein
VVPEPRAGDASFVVPTASSVVNGPERRLIRRWTLSSQPLPRSPSMSNLASAPVAGLVFVGILLAFIGLFAGSLPVMTLGVASLFGAGLIGAVASRRG